MKLLLVLPLSSHTWVPFMMSPAFSLFSTSSFSSTFFVSYPHHHHIHSEGSARASCSTITSPNPPPSVCISSVLIAPETQSNGQEMCAGVQLTGSPLFRFPLFPSILFTAIHFLKPYVFSFAHPNPVLCPFLPPAAAESE